jgi:hypothetical protein
MAAIAEFIAARLAEREALAKTAQRQFPGPWDRSAAPGSPLPSAISLYDSRGESLGVLRGSYAADHIAANDPASVLRDVEATRSLVAEILSFRHDEDPERGCARIRCQPCDCGRDARVRRLLGIIAGRWEPVTVPARDGQEAVGEG